MYPKKRFRPSRDAGAPHLLNEAFQLSANGKHLGLNRDELVGAHVRATAVLCELLLQHKWEAESLNVNVPRGNTATSCATVSDLPVWSQGASTRLLRLEFGWVQLFLVFLD